MVRRHAVSQSVRAAGVFRHVPADRAGLLTGRVGRVVVAFSLDCGGDVEVDDAGLNDGIFVFEVDFENLVHPREGDHQTTLGRDRPAAQPRAGAAADQRQAVFPGDFDDVDDILGRGREDDALGSTLFNAAVELIEQQVLRTVEYAALAQQLPQFRDRFRGNHNLMIY